MNIRYTQYFYLVAATCEGQTSQLSFEAAQHGREVSQRHAFVILHKDEEGVLLTAVTGY